MCGLNEVKGMELKMNKFEEFVMWALVICFISALFLILWFLLPSIDKNKLYSGEQVCFANCNYFLWSNSLFDPKDEIVVSKVSSYKNYYFKHKVYIKYTEDEEERYAILDYSENKIELYKGYDDMKSNDYKIFKNKKFNKVKQND